MPAAHRGREPAASTPSSASPTMRSTRHVPPTPPGQGEPASARCTGCRSRSRTRSTRPGSSRPRAPSAGPTRVPERDATVVARLKAAGGILLGKTNTPEFTWANEADNLVYGRTSNPYDLDRSSGGSSGGSAAIVAAGGSPFDIGSDTGDSIRQPSHVCGVAGLKPTSGRVPRTGHHPVVPRDPGVAHPARADRPSRRRPRPDPADHRRTGRRGPAHRPGRARRSGRRGDRRPAGRVVRGQRHRDAHARDDGHGPSGRRRPARRRRPGGGPDPAGPGPRRRALGSA